MKALVVVGLAVLLVLSAARSALAAFSDPATSTASFTAATLAPPTNLSATAGCSTNTGTKYPVVNVTWTRSTQLVNEGTVDAGQEVYLQRGTNASTEPGTTTAVTAANTSAQIVSTVTGSTTRLALNTQYYVAVLTTWGQDWRSTYPYVTVATPRSC